LYILYVDYSKAFACVQDEILWYVLLKNGFHGNFTNVIRNMYEKLISCVKISYDELSEYFRLEVGKRQGCMLSPSPFIQFLNEYLYILENDGCKGVYVSEEVPNLLALMYADDIGNIADTVGRLQTILNTVKLRYEALHYDTISDMSRWARGPQGFKVYSETLKFFYIIARKLENVTTLRDLLTIWAIIIS